jgi:tetratricopeptide (TPR) repeat protein
MNKMILKLVVSGTLLAVGLAEAKPIDAKLVLGKNRSWTGSLISRDGDWVEFQKLGAPTPMRLGAGTIKEPVFKVDIDLKNLSKKMKTREYEQVIVSLNKALKPFSEYSDIPSNLTKYNAVLMEIYYRNQQYEKSIAIASKIVKDDRDPALQEKSRMYHVLALIDAGKTAEAEAQRAEYGWDVELSNDAAPEQLYIAAKLQVLNKQYSEAMEYVAKVIAFNSQDPDWMRPAEMLCAEVYTKLGLYDSAEEVCRQIEFLYKDSPEFDKAQELKLEIKQLRADQKLEEA